MNRTPPTEIRRILRKEVGFGCPVPNCGSPYLEWHHFDPPWRVIKHHDSKGMIALCTEHHKKADSGGFTVEQLRQFKQNGRMNFEPIKGRFDWFRNKLLVATGSNLYYGSLTILKIGTKPVIWLQRDKHGYLLLNLRMLTLSNQKRLILEDNDWIEKGQPIDFECPPSGKLIHVRYQNGDKLGIEFFNMDSSEQLKNKYPNNNIDFFNLDYPVTLIEIEYHIEGANISFTASSTNVKNITAKYGCFKSNNTIFALPYDARLLEPELYKNLENFLKKIR